MAEEKKIVCMVTSYKKGTIAVSHAGVRSDWMEQDGPAVVVPFFEELYGNTGYRYSNIQ